MARTNYFLVVVVACCECHVIYTCTFGVHTAETRAGTGRNVRTPQWPALLFVCAGRRGRHVDARTTAASPDRRWHSSAGARISAVYKQEISITGYMRGIQSSRHQQQQACERCTLALCTVLCEESSK